jgi:DNA-binding MurR/RpiR family transcriptional regulator
MFQDRIREYYDDLTPGFRRLADFLLNNTLDAAFLTASELARRVKVDPATVVRFSQDIGYSGYRELSREIKRYVRDQVTSTYRPAKESKTEADILNAIFENTNQQLDHFRTTETPNLAKAVEILNKASRIWITGEFTSFDLASFLARNLDPTVGIPAVSFHPGIAETANAVVNMKPDDVLLAIVFGIPGLDTGYAIQQANAKGLKTICISNSGTMLPAREADVAIIVPTVSPVTIASFTTTLIIMGAIWEALTAEDTALAAESFNTLHSNMGEVLSLRTQSKVYEIPDE